MLDKPPEHDKRITEMWAWVAVHPNGGEGIPAMMGADGILYPLVGADRERMESLRPYAVQVSAERSMPVKLVSFHEVKVHEEITP